MENSKVINKYLKEHYGYAQDGKPKFRVAFSDDLFEVRKGLFSEVQVYEDIRRVPKYSFLKGKWILEIYTLAYPELYGPAIRAKEGIVMSGDGYEPLRVFMTRKGEYLRPDMEICKIICDNWCELVNRPEARRLTEKMATYDDVKIMRAEYDKFMDILNQDGSYHKFRDGEAIILPGKEIS